MHALPVVIWLYVKNPHIERSCLNSFRHQALQEEDQRPRLTVVIPTPKPFCKRLVDGGFNNRSVSEDELSSPEQNDTFSSWHFSELMVAL